MLKTSIFLWCVFLCNSTHLFAQESSVPVRFRGEIIDVTSNEITINERLRGQMKFNIAPDQSVQEVFEISKDMIHANSYIGSAGMIEPDGRVKALELLLFPEAARGTGEGHYQWDLQEGSTMTNATVEKISADNNDLEFSVRFKGGEKKIVVTNNTPIVSIKPGDKTLLVLGAYVVITANDKNGKWNVLRISAGRNGFKPPM